MRHGAKLLRIQNLGIADSEIMFADLARRVLKNDYAVRHCARL
jgi:hypothetical protein